MRSVAVKSEEKQTAGLLVRARDVVVALARALSVSGPAYAGRR